jgi:hypothetical protein
MMAENEPDPIAQAFLRANQINARLAAAKYDAALVSEGKRIAEQLLSYVKEQVKDYDDFARRCERSELFPLHESAQVEKNEVRFKGLYLRATGLLESIQEAESRRPR